MKFHQHNSIGMILLFSSMALTGGCSQSQFDGSPQAIVANSEGIQDIQAGNHRNAKQMFIEALKYDPLDPVFQINLGYAFEKLEQNEEAIQTYDAALKLTEDEETRFYAYFNKATLLGKAGRIDEALSAYQNALDQNPPEEWELEVKTNIELLVQQQDGGGGQGDSENQDQQDENNSSENDNNDENNKDENEEDKNEQNADPRDQKPQKFESQELNENDVRRIFEELIRQEQRVRSEYNRQQSKEPTRGKNW